jgi:phospholipid transport system substrate-binding protein
MQRLIRGLSARALFFACCVMATIVIAAPRETQAASSPTATIEAFYGTLLNTMKNAGTAGEKGRYEELLPAIHRDFDLAYMTRLAVGPAWNRLSDAQKQRVSEAFSHYITATYADNFDSYSGERFQVIGQRTTPYGTIVQSRIIKSDGSPIAINYLMVENGGHWQVGDIYLTGSISQLATLRSQFSSVLARNGADGLTALLNRKAETLVANAAR